ncbi:hypothetical protein [Embleya sp. NPDC020630]
MKPKSKPRPERRGAGRRLARVACHSFVLAAASASGKVLVVAVLWWIRRH